MKLTIDRIEEGIAVLEPEGGKAMLHVPVEALPQGAREGQVLEQTAQGYELLPEQTRLQKQAADAKLQALLQRTEARRRTQR